MATHKTGTRDQWLAARLALLEAEKDYSRRGDELAAASGAAVGCNRAVVYHWLDRAPKGRNETGPWWHRHDEYAELKAGQSDHLAMGSRSLG
jgi:predicted dithiol-disulfide oxidoreductase (DUF899 family)